MDVFTKSATHLHLSTHGMMIGLALVHRVVTMVAAI